MKYGTDIVMLAAGTSSRMGSINKMLLPYRDMTIVAYSCMQALLFLERHSERTGEPCTLVVVTGYRRLSVEKALKPCREFIEKTDARLEMIVVNNPDYLKGQFTSTKAGVAQVEDNRPFFISLADMPLIRAEHYEKLVPLLGAHDAVRPFYENSGDRVPGHPVLLACKLKKTILQYPDSWTVSRILKSTDVFEPLFSDPSWTQDIDIPQDYDLISNPVIEL